jgi:phosphoribosylanthranilate isomerase
VVAAHPRYAGIDVDTAARDADGRFAGPAVLGIARAWHTARHTRNEVA